MGDFFNILSYHVFTGEGSPEFFYNIMNAWAYNPLSHLHHRKDNPHQPGSTTSISRAMKKVIIPLYRDITPQPTLATFKEFFRNILSNKEQQRGKILLHAIPIPTKSQKRIPITSQSHCSKKQYREKLKLWISVAEAIKDQNLKAQVENILENEDDWDKLIETDISAESTTDEDEDDRNMETYHSEKDSSVDDQNNQSMEERDGKREEKAKGRKKRIRRIIESESDVEGTSYFLNILHVY